MSTVVNGDIKSICGCWVIIHVSKWSLHLQARTDIAASACASQIFLPAIPARDRVFLKWKPRRLCTRWQSGRCASIPPCAPGPAPAQRQAWAGTAKSPGQQKGQSEQTRNAIVHIYCRRTANYFSCITKIFKRHRSQQCLCLVCSANPSNKLKLFFCYWEAIRSGVCQLCFVIQETVFSFVWFGLGFSSPFMLLTKKSLPV